MGNKETPFGKGRAGFVFGIDFALNPVSFGKGYRFGQAATVAKQLRFFISPPQPLPFSELGTGVFLQEFCPASMPQSAAHR
jgi:hypothetical protein